MEYCSYANNLFEKKWWLDIVAKNEWYDIIIKDGNEIVARMPIYLKNKILCNPIYTQTFGIWLSEKVKIKRQGNSHLSLQKEIINEIINKMPNNKGINIVLDNSFKYVLPFRWKGFNINPTFSYRISNFNEINDIDKFFSNNILRDIKKSKKYLNIEYYSKNYEEFIELQNYSYKRQNRKNPINNSFTYNVIKNTIESGHGNLMFARDEKMRAHAGCFFVYDDAVCYLLLSGQNTEFGIEGAVKNLIYEGIKYSKTISKSFDFEGSMVEGIEQIYRRFGGDQIINWNIVKQPIYKDFYSIIKPRVKKFIGYKN